MFFPRMLLVTLMKAEKPLAELTLNVYLILWGEERWKKVLKGKGEKLEFS